MKEYNYFPFERNRYYYGKLLSVEDFQREQAYMNQKRQMLNRLLYGAGVLCGMQVLEVDEESISVEMGVALDAYGREIVIDQPIVKRLSVLEGFSEHCVRRETSGELYLCIAYKEEESDPVHSIGAGGNEPGKHLEYNKWKEGYQLFLTSDAPTGNQGLSDECYEEVRTIYEGQGLRIRQVMPRFLEKNQEAILRIWVDKISVGETIAFQYDIAMTGASYQGEHQFTVSFREEEWQSADHYELEYRIQAAVEEVDGTIQILPDTFLFELGVHKQMIAMEERFQFQVISGKKEQAVWNSYCQMATENTLMPSGQVPLYLARISVIQAGDAYVIDKVENLPCQQYVWNNRLLGTLTRMGFEKKQEENMFQSSYSRQYSEATHREAGHGQQHAYGVVQIPMGIGGAAGQCFYSEEIVHGLGLGIVFVSVAAVCEKKQGREVVYGTRDIFSEEKGEVKVETAVKLLADKGSFIIGIRCLEEVHEDSLTVYWHAVRNKEDEEIQVRQCLTIRPSMPRILVRQSVYLEAMLGEERQTDVQWKVADPEGGSIDDAGKYTAPNQSGVYQIFAKSRSDQKLAAIAYVIVGDEP